MDSFRSRTHLTINQQTYEIFSLANLDKKYQVERLPYSLKILLENLLRTEDNISVSAPDIEALLNWQPQVNGNHEIAFSPSRVILQDFTGVPAVVDLAAMREAMTTLEGNPQAINPLSPVELVIDHSVMVDNFGHASSFKKNTALEFKRNQERYAFLRWGQTAFENFKVVPPGTGIVHQVNLEYLARVVFTKPLANGTLQAYPDTLVGTDSHTTMINGLGVLGWGVGGIEAEAAMLGQPVTMLIPQVIGFELTGELPEGATGTDLVLTVVEILRQQGVVGKFVEFFGDGLDHLPLADRATIANMAPEYGATCGIFPIDEKTLKFLRLTGRDEQQIALIEAYSKAQGLFREPGEAHLAQYSEHITLNLAEVEPCIAGPKRPQDRIALRDAKANHQRQLFTMLAERQNATTDDNALNEGAHIIEGEVALELNGQALTLKHGDVVIAAITSCTNTSNPAVMLAAGLVAQAAQARGLTTKPWVKTSLAPGSQVVMDYLKQADLLTPLEHLGFNLVGYGCTTCIGNSGPLPEKVSQAINRGNLAVSAVLSGNRNFEGRIHPEVRNAYLASPPLVVAYALAGTMDIDFSCEPLGIDHNHNPVYLKDIWPKTQTIEQAIEQTITPEMFRQRYALVFQGDSQWQGLSVPDSEQYVWQDDSTYVKLPPYFEHIRAEPLPLQDIKQAQVLIKVGDSVTTDHISPAGAIAPNSPAANYLQEHGVNIQDFNSYGSRRGNHEVMVRGTFANPRLRNQLAPDTQGGWTLHWPTHKVMSIFEAATLYKKDNVPLIILAGKEYGTGSSRDWAAKGPALLGIKVVIAESFERIHRSNLIGMGILPLQFLAKENAQTLKLTGAEHFSLALSALSPQGQLTVTAQPPTGQAITFSTLVRIDTPKELSYYQHGGILHYVLRKLAQSKQGK